MEFKEVIKICVDFALDNGANICTYPKHRDSANHKVRIQSHNDDHITKREVTIESVNDGGSWRVDSTNLNNNNNNEEAESFPPVNTEKLLRETLSSAWNNSPIQAAANLLDAKLADVHAKLEDVQGKLTDVQAELVENKALLKQVLDMLTLK
jgi:hypothetical protein